MEKNKDISLFGIKISLQTKVSLQVKLTLALVLFSSALSVFYFMLAYTQAISTLNNGLGENLQTIAVTTSISLAKKNWDILLLQNNYNAIAKTITVRNKEKDDLVKELYKLQQVNKVESIFVLFKKKNKAYVLMESSPSKGTNTEIEINKILDEAFSGIAVFEKALPTAVSRFKSAYAPVYYRNKTVAVIGVTATSDKILYAIKEIRSYHLFFLLLSLMLSFLLAILIARAINSPLSLLLAGTERIGRGDLNFRVKVKNLFSFLPFLNFRDEMGELAISFNDMTIRLAEKEDENKQLYQEINQFNKELANRIKLATAELEAVNKNLREKEKQRDEELKLAKVIQKALLPETLNVKDISINTLFLPAAEVGGDFFRIFPLTPDNLILVIGDVEGRGVPAALLMAITLGIIYESAWTFLSPAKIFKRANQALREHLTRDFSGFTSAFCGALNLKTYEFTFSKAGHELPLWYKHSKKQIEFLNASGFFLGTFLKSNFTENKINLQPGDKILFYTDGLVELKSKDGEIFGEEKLKQILIEYGDLNIDNFMKKLQEEINNFKTTQQDDIAVLCLERNK